MKSTHTKITLYTLIERNSENLLISEIGDELVMMDLHGGNYVSLNKTGRIIWELIDQPIDVKSLLGKLMKRFDVLQDVCTNDTLECLQNMHLQKLIVIK